MTYKHNITSELHEFEVMWFENESEIQQTGRTKFIYCSIVSEYVGQIE